MDVLDSFHFNFWPGPEGIKNTGYYFPEIIKNPHKYIIKVDLNKTFEHLKSLGLSLFIASNSGIEYGSLIIKTALGDVSYIIIY